MSIRSTFVSLVFAMFAAGVAAHACAQQRREGPCAADVKKFCGDVKPGQGAIAKCMKAHEAELSPACRETSKARAEKAERVREECRADAEKFCKGIAPGRGRILSCLKSRQQELQPACAAEFKRAK
jgi:cysteine rich repeat protein